MQQAGDLETVGEWPPVTDGFGIAVISVAVPQRAFCGGHGVVIFFGAATPVRAPMIGLASSHQYCLLSGVRAWRLRSSAVGFASFSLPQRAPAIAICAHHRSTGLTFSLHQFLAGRR